MLRRHFISIVSGALASWPLLARTQHAAMPVIGFISSLSSNEASRVMDAFRQGLAETDYVEGRNVAIEYRWAAGDFNQLGRMAADLVRREVTILAAVSGTPTALAAKAATTTIPIVFAIGSDPVSVGLVNSLNRPGGNITGATFFNGVMGAKRLELLLQLAPKDAAVAILTNPHNPPVVAEGENALNAVRSFGRQASIFGASTPDQIEEAFRAIQDRRFGSVYVASDPFFLVERRKLIASAAQSLLPAIYSDREITDAGGLMSYGASRTDAYQQAGRYVGRILRGEKAGDLPVILPTKFELIINLQTAKTLGLTVPNSLLAQATEVVE